LIFNRSNSIIKIIFVITVLFLVFNPIGVRSDHVLTTRNSVVDVKYTLYRECQSITSSDQSLPWPQRASNCQPVAGNIDNTLKYRYTGIGPTVPPDILAQFPEANSQLIEPFKTAMVGLPEGGFRSFMVLSDQAYGDGDLFFDITIIKIYNPEPAPHLDTTTNNNVIVTGDNSLFIGVAAIAVLGSGGAFAFFKLQNPPSVKTEEIISSGKARETEKIQSLKNVLAKQEGIKGNTGIKGRTRSLTKQKQPKSRRRR
jgi:hypothetical protein